jgi:hypothetical protein
MNDIPNDIINEDELHKALKENEAKVLYNMYKCTANLGEIGEIQDVTYENPRDGISKVVIEGKNCKVFYENGTTKSYTEE